MPAMDFSNVQGLEPLPEGVYNATIVVAEEGVSAKGQPKIDIRWQVETAEGQKRNVFDTLSFHPDAQWRTKATLIALGFDKEFNGNVDASDLLGCEAMISLTIQTGQTDPATGEPYPPRNRVVKVRSVDYAVDALVNN